MWRRVAFLLCLVVCTDGLNLSHMDQAFRGAMRHIIKDAHISDDAKGMLEGNEVLRKALAQLEEDVEDAAAAAADEEPVYWNFEIYQLTSMFFDESGEMAVEVPEGTPGAVERGNNFQIFEIELLPDGTVRLLMRGPSVRPVRIIATALSQSSNDEVWSLEFELMFSVTETGKYMPFLVEYNPGSVDRPGIGVQIFNLNLDMLRMFIRYQTPTFWVLPLSLYSVTSATLTWRQGLHYRLLFDQLALYWLGQTDITHEMVVKRLTASGLPRYTSQEYQAARNTIFAETEEVNLAVGFRPLEHKKDCVDSDCTSYIYVSPTEFHIFGDVIGAYYTAKVNVPFQVKATEHPAIVSREGEELTCEDFTSQFSIPWTLTGKARKTVLEIATAHWWHEEEKSNLKWVGDVAIGALDKTRAIANKFLVRPLVYGWKEGASTTLDAISPKIRTSFETKLESWVCLAFSWASSIMNLVGEVPPLPEAAEVVADETATQLFFHGSPYRYYVSHTTLNEPGVPLVNPGPKVREVDPSLQNEYYWRQDRESHHAMIASLKKPVPKIGLSVEGQTQESDHSRLNLVVKFSMVDYVKREGSKLQITRTRIGEAEEDRGLTTFVIPMKTYYELNPETSFKRRMVALRFKDAATRSNPQLVCTNHEFDAATGDDVTRRVDEDGIEEIELPDGDTSLPPSMSDLPLVEQFAGTKTMEIKAYWRLEQIEVLWREGDLLQLTIFSASSPTEQSFVELKFEQPILTTPYLDTVRLQVVESVQLKLQKLEGIATLSIPDARLLVGEARRVDHGHGIGFSVKQSNGATDWRVEIGEEFAYRSRTTIGKLKGFTSNLARGRLSWERKVPAGTVDVSVKACEKRAKLGAPRIEMLFQADRYTSFAITPLKLFAKALSRVLYVVLGPVIRLMSGAVLNLAVGPDAEPNKYICRVLGNSLAMI